MGVNTKINNSYYLMLGEMNVIGGNVFEEVTKDKVSADLSINTDVVLKKIGNLNEMMHLAKGHKGFTNLSLIYQTLSNTSDTRLTTRQIADICGLSIYVTRNWLTKLNEAGLIHCHFFDGKSLGWSMVCND